MFEAPRTNEQDMQILKIIADILTDEGFHTSTKIIEKAKKIDISTESTIESIKILFDLSCLDAKYLGHNLYNIKGLSYLGFGLYRERFLPDYKSLLESIASHIVSNPHSDSNSISDALSINLFIVNHTLIDLESNRYIELGKKNTPLVMNQYLYKVVDISPALERECKGNKI